MDQRISIITLTVKDLVASKEFYSNILGWKAIESDDESIVFYQMNGFQLALYPQSKYAEEHDHAEAQSPSGFSLAYNVNSEQEVDELFEILESNNVNILKRPVKVFWGGYSGYIAGPDGEQWEVAYNPFTSVNPDGSYGKLATQ